MVNHKDSSAFSEVIREALIYRLITFGMTPFHSEDSLAGIVRQIFPNRILIVFVLRIGGAHIKSSDLTLSLLAPIKERIRNRLVCEGVLCGDNLAAIVVNTEIWEEKYVTELKQELAEELMRLESRLKNSATLCIGIGSIINRVEELKFSYRQALAASEYQTLLGSRSVIEYAEIVNRETHKGEYPFDTEALLLHAVRGGQQERAVQLLNQFIQEIAKGTVRELHLSLLQLGSAIKRIPLPDEKGDGAEPLRLITLDQELLSANELERKLQLVRLEIEKRVHYKNQEEREKRVGITQTATNYIEQNYNRFDLSVESLAEHVGFSAGYIRRLFKDVYGCSPTEYIFNLRLDKAKQLLRETDQTAKIIAEEVGYGNIKYFYNTFKKTWV